MTDPSPQAIKKGIDRATRNWRKYWQAVVAGVTERTELSTLEALQFLTLVTVTEVHNKLSDFSDYMIEAVEKSKPPDEPFLGDDS